MNIRKGDRVRATQDIRFEDYPFVDIKAGTEGTVVGKDTPEKALSIWRVTILFDGVGYAVQFAYPTEKVEKMPALFLPNV